MDTNSSLLELSASDDLLAFRTLVEDKGFDVDAPSFWYGRRFGSKKMGFHEMTPLMIAAMFGSTHVLTYLIGTSKVDVNRACGSDMVTALHCAVAGASASSLHIVNLLLQASADANSVDANGNRPVDLIAPAVNSNRKGLELLLKGNISDGEEKLLEVAVSRHSKDGSEKKEYPMDVSLPDINNVMYNTDEFRMYSFKVKPCSRAYSHDWTECPFVHPGENARRRDPRKYPYSCVPCPEFRKGTCQKGDACEYAHGIFESWLHPAQYRTRLCKDETGCSRKVCFFAHKPEELRPVYASTGSAMPSPKSISASALDMTALSPMALGPSSLSMPTTSTPPMSTLMAASSPKGGSLWKNKVNLTPPTLQLPGSRLKAALSARDLELEIELLKLESQSSQQHQQLLMDEIANLSSPSCWNKDFSRVGELDDVYGSLDHSMSQLQGLTLRSSTPSHLQSPTSVQICQNMNQLRTSLPVNLPSSPVRKPPTFGFDSSAAIAAAMMNSGTTAFTKRSQSFIDRGDVTLYPGLTGAANSTSMMPSSLSGWSSPNGKLDWGFQGDELNKLKKSSSFAYRNKNKFQSNVGEPDVSWVHSLVKEKQQYNVIKGVHDMLPPWMEQLYMEQEQMVA